MNGEKRPKKSAIIERLRATLTTNGKSEFVSHGQVSLYLCFKKYFHSKISSFRFVLSVTVVLGVSWLHVVYFEKFST